MICGLGVPPEQKPERPPASMLDAGGRRFLPKLFLPDQLHFIGKLRIRIAIHLDAFDNPPARRTGTPAR